MLWFQRHYFVWSLAPIENEAIAAMASYRALVVDDEVTVRRYTTLALSREGFQCDVADDGTEAGHLLEAKQYDAVITDLRMPNTNGMRWWWICWPGGSGRLWW